MSKYNLSEFISIDIWERIALYVQFLDFSNKSDDEFMINLSMLDKALIENGIRFDMGKRSPVNDFQVGLSSILENIYNSYSICNNVKYNFFEQVSLLKKLGVLRVAFREEDFLRDKKLIMYSNIQDNFINNMGYSILNKLYTDASFNLESDILYYYMSNLKDLNYLLDIKLCFSNNRQIIGNIDSFTAVLTCFKGVYTDIDMLLSREYPMIDSFCYDDCINMGIKVNQYLYKNNS